MQQEVRQLSRSEGYLKTANSFAVGLASEYVEFCSSASHCDFFSPSQEICSSSYLYSLKYKFVLQILVL